MNDPGSNHGLTAESIRTTFPIALQEDPSAAALADVTARLLARRPEEIDRLRIYPDIFRLDDKLLDILAYDFKVDWWDPNYTLEEKRRTLADSWRVHKLLGTKAAVEMAIRAIYPETMVEEWFEYEDGKPYHFRLSINITNDNVDSVRQRRVLDRLNFYKNLRSHLDRVTYFMKPVPALADAGGFVVATHVHEAAVITPPPEVGPPRGLATPSVVGGATGIYRMISAAVDIPVAIPETRGSAQAVGAVAGRRREIRTCVDVPATAMSIQIPALARGGFCGTYRTLNAEITINASAPVAIESNNGTHGAYCGTYRQMDTGAISFPDPPAVVIEPFAKARGSFCGTYRKFNREIIIDDAPVHRDASVHVQGACCGSWRKMSVSIPVDLQPVTVMAERKACVGVTGMHRKMIREEPINGALD